MFSCLSKATHDIKSETYSTMDLTSREAARVASFNICAKALSVSQNMLKENVQCKSQRYGALAQHADSARAINILDGGSRIRRARRVEVNSLFDMRSQSDASCLPNCFRKAYVHLTISATRVNACN